jgi:RNA polymerase sigma factor (sigma-70 family)
MMVTMADPESLSTEFEAHRSRLQGIAYRMLGSLSDADDAVQETWIRLERSASSDIENLGGWLTTVVSRVCLNTLRARGTRREEPLGVHIPDPIVVAESSPQDEVVLADSIGLALLVVLDTLTPAERLAFVLHDMFELPFEEVGSIVGRSAQTTRQLASRARRRIKSAGVGAPEPDRSRQREVVDAFFEAARGGDFEALVRVLDPEVVLRSDLGGQRAAGVIRGSTAVATRATQFANPRAVLHPVLVNGSAGVIVTVGGRPFSVLGFTVSGGRITHIHGIGDPDRVIKIATEVLGLD